jgi:hypothetical protein
MAAKPNLLDLGLSKEEHELVKRGAALYKASVLEAFDNVFVIARAIEVLQKRNYGKGVQGGFTIALVQCGFTSPDGIKPINASIRSDYADLLEHETEVREWWATKVPDTKKDVWLSARAIHRNWKNSTKPKQTRKPRKLKAPLPQPMTEEEIRQHSTIKPTKEAMETKAAAEAEAERHRLDSEEVTLDTMREELQRMRIERTGMLSEIEELRAAKANEFEELGELGVGAAKVDEFASTMAEFPEQERFDLLSKLVARWGYTLTVPQQPEPAKKPPKKRGSKKKEKAVPAKGSRDAAETKSAHRRPANSAN